MEARSPHFTYEHVKPVTALTALEVELICLQLGLEDRLLVRALAYAGCRSSEILGLKSGLGLKWGQVLLGDDGVTRLHVCGGRSRNPRMAVAFAPLADDLAAYRGLVAPVVTDPVFPDRNGECWSQSKYQSWVQRVFKPAALAAGVPHATPFMLRHHYAGALILSGMDIIEVAERIDIHPDQAVVQYSKVIDKARGVDPVDPVDAIHEAVRMASETDKERE